MLTKQLLHNSFLNCMTIYGSRKTVSTVIIMVFHNLSLYMCSPYFLVLLTSIGILLLRYSSFSQTIRDPVQRIRLSYNLSSYHPPSRVEPSYACSFLLLPTDFPFRAFYCGFLSILVTKWKFGPTVYYTLHVNRRILRQIILVEPRLTT